MSSKHQPSELFSLLLVPREVQRQVSRAKRMHGDSLRMFTLLLAAMLLSVCRYAFAGDTKVAIVTKLGVERIIVSPRMGDCGSELVNHLASERNGFVVAHLVLEKKTGLYHVIPLPLVARIDFSVGQPVVMLRSGVRASGRLVNCAISQYSASAYKFSSLTKFEVIDPGTNPYETESNEEWQIDIGGAENYDTTFTGFEPRLIVYSAAGRMMGAGADESESFWIKLRDEELEAFLSDFRQVALDVGSREAQEMPRISVTSMSGSTTNGVFVAKGKDNRGTHEGNYLGLAITLKGQNEIRVVVGPEWGWRLSRKAKK
jgi:hypothetical protein